MACLCSQVPEFTTTKWGCMKDGCAALQAAIQRPPWRPWQLRRPRSPLEKFFDKCRELMKGVTDDTDPKKPKYHPPVSYTHLTLPTTPYV